MLPDDENKAFGYKTNWDDKEVFFTDCSDLYLDLCIYIYTDRRFAFKDLNPVAQNEIRTNPNPQTPPPNQPERPQNKILKPCFTNPKV